LPLGLAEGLGLGLGLGLADGVVGDVEVVVVVADA
jgi:hypothetical protein